MPLNIIPYQPLYLNDRPTDCFGCEDDYCIPFQPGDPVHAQYQQTPCHPSIACDGDFSSIGGGSEVLPDGDFNELGAEELINGTFTGNATGWALGTGWAYNANNVRKTAGTASSISQLFAIPLVQYAIYRVEFTISNRTAGAVTPRFVLMATTDNGTAASTNTTHVQYIKTSNAMEQFGLTADAAFDGDIDTVSVKRIAASWDFSGDELDGWGMDASGFAQTIHLGAYGIQGGGGTTTALNCLNTITPNTNYTVTVEIEDGQGLVAFGVGSNFSQYFTLTGGPQTISFVILSGLGTTFLVTPSATTDTEMKISEISVIEEDDNCWTFDGGQWSLTGGAICKTPGASDTLINSATLLSGEYYQIKVTVENRTQGFVQFSVNGQPLIIAQPNVIIAQSNNTFVMYVTPTADSQLSIFASALFDGCISNVQIFTLRKDYVFELRDLNGKGNDGDLIAIISDHDGQAFNFVRYFQDYITLVFTFDDPTFLDILDRPIEYGCYNIYAYDDCEVQYEELIGDGEFINPENVYWWDQQAAHPATEIITGGRIEFDLAAPNAIDQQSTIVNNYLGSGPSFQNNVPGIPVGAHNYRLEWDIISSDDTNIKMTVKFGLQRPIIDELSTVGSHSITLSFDPEYTTPARHWLSLRAVWPAGTSGTVIVDNVSAHRIEPFDATYISQCIKYAESFPCTKYVKAYADANQMDFEFENTGFFLGQRLYLRAINPDYPEDQSDYLYSEGTRAKNFFQTQKNFVMLTGLIPEWTHDSLRVQRGMQHFQIGEPLETFTEYFAFEGYKPSWQGNGQFELAPVRFEIAIKDRDAKFFRNT